MRRWIVTAMFLSVFVLAGCAGQSADLLTYDNISAAATQAKAGVVAYDRAVQKNDEQKRAEIISGLNRDIVVIAQKSLSPDDARKLADRVTVAMTQHMTNLDERNSLRQKLYEPTVDNLDYIIQLCDQGRQFSIYRASVSEQWKSYLQSTARAKIKTIEGAK